MVKYQWHSDLILKNKQKFVMKKNWENSKYPSIVDRTNCGTVIQ